jgi:hypothetical protein
MGIGEGFVILLVVILICLIWYNVYRLTEPRLNKPEIVNGIKVIQKSKMAIPPEELNRKIKEYQKRVDEYELLKKKYNNNVTPLNPKPRNPGPGPGGAA